MESVKVWNGDSYVMIDTCDDKVTIATNDNNIFDSINVGFKYRLLGRNSYKVVWSGNESEQCSDCFDKVNDEVHLKDEDDEVNESTLGFYDTTSEHTDDGIELYVDGELRTVTSTRRSRGDYRVWCDTSGRLGILYSDGAKLVGYTKSFPVDRS